MIELPYGTKLFIAFSISAHPPINLLHIFKFSWRDWLSAHLMLMHVLHMIVSAAECKVIQSLEPALVPAGPGSPSAKISRSVLRVSRKTPNLTDLIVQEIW
jgi:hypothetical protein